MTETALFYNTFVCLPTGLGKTFVATNVMLNYYLWFDEGLIFFLAPNKPLVNQQLESIRNIPIIKNKHVVELTGEIIPKKRREICLRKRIFFMTP